MKNNRARSKKFYLGLIILIAASGTIFFFPLNIGGRYTCFYHRIFDSPQSIASADGSYMQDDYRSGQDIHIESPQQYADLLHNYLKKYAFIWWGSVGILAFCIYVFLKLKKTTNMNNSSL